MDKEIESLILEFKKNNKLEIEITEKDNNVLGGYTYKSLLEIYNTIFPSNDARKIIQINCSDRYKITFQIVAAPGTDTISIYQLTSSFEEA